MSLSLIDNEKLKDLTPEERQAVLKILSEYSIEGESSSYNTLIDEDWEETPVDIVTFLHDRRYLGNGLIDDDGRYTVFPYWEQTLQKLFPNRYDTAYNTLVLTGSIGTGKSFMAVLCMLYLLYRMICLKDPYVYYGLQPIDKITFSLMNVTLETARGVGWDKLQSLLQSSPWFLEHGTLRGTTNIEWEPPKGIELITGSRNNHIIGRAVFANFTDEVNFSAMTQDPEKMKQKQKHLISQVDARMKSRFMKGMKLPTLNIIVSSATSEQSFLYSYIDMKKKNESKTTLIIDEPQWVIRTDKDTKEHFYVAIGNKFMDSEIISRDATKEVLQDYVDRGFRLLEVPISYYENFLEDIDTALTDIAGISTTSTMSFISGPRWAACRDDSVKNPFTKEVITVGNAPDDLTQYSDFFDITRIPPEFLEKPLYIHLDMSISGDKTGISGTFVAGKVPHKEGIPDSKELYYRAAFSVAVKAPKGRQISFEKNRQFIYWLRDQGFRIKMVSCDSFQSADLLQSLSARGIPCELISVDRLQDKVCVPYQVFKNAIYEQRLKIYPTDLLTEEIIRLEKLSTGKIDHPADFSKDIADSLCGSLYSASKHAEEYAFEYGEDFEIMQNVNNQEGYSSYKEQFDAEFQQTVLQSRGILDNLGNYKGMDFGLGPAKPLEEMYKGKRGTTAIDGMLIW